MILRSFTLIASIIFSILGQIGFVIAQDLSVKGYFDTYLNVINQRTTALAYGRCFEGLGLYSCKPIFPDDDQILALELPYFLTVGSISGSNYCLQCCSSVPSNIDVWDLYCPVTTPALVNQVNLYGYEARFARNSFDGDSVVIRCPLRRSACTYDNSGNTLSCNRASDATFLAGYTLTLDVVQYNVNFKYWRGVSKCSIETIEVNATYTGNFQEKIIMRHIPPTIPPWDYSKIGFFSFFIILLAYGLLYCCRRKHCPYCGNKLVLSRQLCYKCRWVGAKVPDPVLLKALEEKGETLQGKIPGIFPGLGMVAGFFRLIFVLVCCSCRRKVKVVPNKYDLMMQELEGNVSISESKIQSLEEDTKSVKYKKAKYKDNPNILEYDAQIIYEAIQHPKFIKDKDPNDKPKKKRKKEDIDE